MHTHVISSAHNNLLQCGPYPYCRIMFFGEFVCHSPIEVSTVDNCGE
ncbi:hypothetical protein [Anaplasma phagocytophilum]|nr:hypothetical protein [Anaplasma phagocytophilum]